MTDEKENKRTKILQQIKNVDKTCKDFFSGNSTGVCPACGKPKYPEVNPHSNVNSISFIFRQDCKCTKDDICKAYYGKTYHELYEELSS